MCILWTDCLIGIRSSAITMSYKQKNWRKKYPFAKYCRFYQYLSHKNQWKKISNQSIQVCPRKWAFFYAKHIQYLATILCLFFYTFQFYSHTLNLNLPLFSFAYFYIFYMPLFCIYLFHLFLTKWIGIALICIYSMNYDMILPI